VAFADINLGGGGPRGNHSPGAGGWPTIKYFNKKTGYDGGSYKKVTSDAMCTELGEKPAGDTDHLLNYIQDYGSTSLCKVSDGAGCSDREKGFITMWKDKKSQDDVKKQLKRLEGMSSGSMKAELKAWISQRMAILKQLADAPKAEL